MAKLRRIDPLHIYDRKRERFDAMLAATDREYTLWMQATDTKYRFAQTGQNGVGPERRERIYEAMARRTERRMMAWERAKVRFYFPPAVAVGA